MLRNLSIRDFRCFTRFDLDFDPGITCIVGGNALGKTSLLEAVVILTRLQSPRTNSLAPVIRTGAKGLVVDGMVDNRHMQFYYSPKRRKLALDSVEQKDAHEYLQVARAVFFANTDIDLVRGTGEERRRFLDFLGSQFFRDYRNILRSYDKALRSRNAYLKMTPARPREVAAYTKPLIDLGQQLTELRGSLVRRLEPKAIAAFNLIGERDEQFGLEYHCGSSADFQAALAASAEEEARLRTTLVGPHRDDLLLQLSGQPAAIYASEGQQRTMAIALKVSHARLLESEFGRSPLLLLDDVFGELDIGRRNRLFATLPAGGQRIITTTSLAWLHDVPAGRLYGIKDDGARGRVLDVISPR
ncbi:MAG: DNA replication/repair protein RecF [Verrucomicrobia bacterium]|nr:DNA replication/repair protein RecF [Verrucomicrobiota bacterium]